MSIDRLKPANADPSRPIDPALPPRRGQPPKQWEERPEAGRRKAETTPEPEPELPPTYSQVTRRGRKVRPPERYIATVIRDDIPATPTVGRRWGAVL